MLKNVKGFIIGLVTVLVIALVFIGGFLYFSKKPTVDTLGNSYKAINTGIKDTIGFQGFEELNSNSPVSFVNYYYYSAISNLVSEYNNTNKEGKLDIYEKLKSIRSELRVMNSTISSVASNDYFMDLCSMTDTVLNAMKENGVVDIFYVNKFNAYLKHFELINTVNSDKFGKTFIDGFNASNHIILHS